MATSAEAGSFQVRRHLRYVTGAIQMARARMRMCFKVRCGAAPCYVTHVTCVTDMRDSLFGDRGKPKAIPFHLLWRPFAPFSGCPSSQFLGCQMRASEEDIEPPNWPKHANRNLKRNMFQMMFQDKDPILRILRHTCITPMKHIPYF